MCARRARPDRPWPGCHGRVRRPPRIGSGGPFNGCRRWRLDRPSAYSVPKRGHLAAADVKDGLSFPFCSNCAEFGPLVTVAEGTKPWRNAAAGAGRIRFMWPITIPNGACPKPTGARAVGKTGAGRVPGRAVAGSPSCASANRSRRLCRVRPGHHRPLGRGGCGACWPTRASCATAARSRRRSATPAPGSADSTATAAVASQSASPIRRATSCPSGFRITVTGRPITAIRGRASRRSGRAAQGRLSHAALVIEPRDGLHGVAAGGDGDHGETLRAKGGLQAVQRRHLLAGRARTRWPRSSAPPICPIIGKTPGPVFGPAAPFRAPPPGARERPACACRLRAGLQRRIGHRRICTKRQGRIEHGQNFAAYHLRRPHDRNPPKAANAMWGGRFAAGPDAIMQAINASIGFDQRLYAQDIAGLARPCRHAGGTGHPDR
jgi:hypothetical protein